ncbi:leucine-zipper-like transcriptional regulator [Anaeramoeba flamelloides]|uniref:Leucine-zipper-like transcriptional regulator n=1 Tax=Anaeramoeba flamelloides TaxID=1746091 RepID=A0AAV7Y4E6_9EUKA|nr:leucine-zipper-like transcriptional regulator [Anaeramoeba flamelloides]
MIKFENSFNRKIYFSEFQTNHINEEDKPVGRSNHGAVCYGEKIYIYGGRDSFSSRSNMLHCLDLKTNRWQLMKPTGCEAPRVSAFSFTLDPVNGKIYLLGGLNHLNESLNTLYEYCIANNEWSQLDNCKYKFVDHAAVWYEGKLWAWGGEDLNERRNTKSVCCYVPKIRAWKVITPKQQNLIGNFISSFTLVVCLDEMYVFGGNRGNYNSNCIYVFSFTTLKWRKIEEPNENTNSTNDNDNDNGEGEGEREKKKWPLERMGHVAEVWGNKMVISSGYSQTKNAYHNDLWVFDTISESWQEIDIKKYIETNNDNDNRNSNSHSNNNKFSGRIRSKIVRSNKNHYYIIGGYTDDYLNDVWQFSFKYSTLEKQLLDLYKNCHDFKDYRLTDNQSHKYDVHKDLIESRLNGHPIEDLQKILKKYSPIIVRNLILYFYTANFNWGQLKVKHLIKLNQISRYFSLNIWLKLSDRSTLFLQREIASLMNKDKSKDFTIIVDNRAIKVHKFMLCLKSELYRGFFNYTGYNTKQNQIKDFSKRSFNAVNSLIHYLYTGTAEHIYYDTAKELIGASDYYGLDLKDNLDYFCLSIIANRHNLVSDLLKQKKIRRRNSIGDISELYYSFNSNQSLKKHQLDKIDFFELI